MFSHAVNLVFAVMMVYFGYLLCVLQVESNQSTLILQIPTVYLYAGLRLMVVISLGVDSGLIIASRAFAEGAFPGIQEWLISLAAVPVTALILRLMRIKQRLARYAELESAGRGEATVIEFNGVPTGPAEPDKPEAADWPPDAHAPAARVRRHFSPNLHLPCCSRMSCVTFRNRICISVG